MKVNESNINTLIEQQAARMIAAEQRGDITELTLAYLRFDAYCQQREATQLQAMERIPHIAQTSNTGGAA